MRALKNFVNWWNPEFHAPETFSLGKHVGSEMVRVTIAALIAGFCFTRKTRQKVTSLKDSSYLQAMLPMVDDGLTGNFLSARQFCKLLCTRSTNTILKYINRCVTIDDRLVLSLTTIPGCLTPTKRNRRPPRVRWRPWVP